MSAPQIVVVTATTDVTRWSQFHGACSAYQSTDAVAYALVTQTEKARSIAFMRDGVREHHETYRGVVPAFAAGLDLALRTYPEAEIFACLHDDCLLAETGWDAQLVEHFKRHWKCGLAGFGGAWGNGEDAAAWEGPYRPDLLVRKGFMSNMVDAEAHGTRVTMARRIAVLDGFSQIMRRDFAIGHGLAWQPHMRQNQFAGLEQLGLVHHAYDCALGAEAVKEGFEVWLLPFKCRHLGGQTAVGDAAYNEWARTQRPANGDQTFWEESHRIVYDTYKDVLPVRVGAPA